MLADQPKQIAQGTLTAGIEHDDSIKAVVAFIQRNFEEFTKKNKGEITLNEKGLSQKICIHLNRNAKHFPFFFQPEYMENIYNGTSPQVDIGTIAEDEFIQVAERDYGAEDSFYSIEAKRLPTPGTNREKEYVIGNNTPCGGIERFKKGLHGPRLKYAAIVGYVQENDFNHWFLKINSWIQEQADDSSNLLWSTFDLINEVDLSVPLVVKLLSEHTRTINGTADRNIRLHHFWINLLPDPEAPA